MVLATLFTLACALSPRVLAFLVPPASLWLVASILTFAMSVPIGLYQASAQLRMPNEESQKISVLWHLPGWALAAAAGVSFLIALTGWISAQGFYLAGTTFSLGIAVWCFVAIVFRKFF